MKKSIYKFIILILGINILTNYNYLLSFFNQNDEIIYDSSNIVIKNKEYFINDINSEIGMIEVIFEKVPQELKIYYKSDNFDNYNHFNEEYKLNDITTDDLYVYSSLKEKVSSLKLVISTGNISKVIINPRVKYRLNIFKTMYVFLLLLILSYIFKNNKKLDLSEPIQKFKIFLLLLLLIEVVVMFSIRYSKIGRDTFYNTLYTDSIINHKLELDYKVSDGLLNDNNPYDTSSRNYNYLWDASYYNGKYYSYFGIWPNLVLLTPYKLITGNYLSTGYASLIYASLAIIVTFLLFLEIVKKYFKDISFNMFILSFIYLILGSKILWCVYRSKYYELLSLAAYFHVILGLYWVLFKNSKKKNILGYCSLAIAVLCRPTALFASILIIPKLLSGLKKKEFKVKDFIMLVVPYLIVGISIMYMNYIRFGSVFEFGTKYQLTACNLYGNSFSLLKVLCATFYYLFGTFSITLFPLRITGVLSSFPILSDFYIENIGGGVIMTSVIGIILFFIPSLFKKIKEKELKKYICLSISLAFLLIFVSGNFNSLIGRYMLDFNYLFYLVIIILSLYLMKIEKNKILEKIYYVGILISIFINFLAILSYNIP